MNAFVFACFLCICSAKAQNSKVVYPVDRSVLNTNCNFKDGRTGTIRLQEHCLNESETYGYVLGVGIAECCASNNRKSTIESNTKSKKYCDINGATKLLFPEDNILNGKKSEVSEFPHMVALADGLVGETEFRCGGSIISEKFILTAAHCVNRKGQPKFVRIGRVSLL